VIRDRPSAVELLEIARETLISELLPHLSEEGRLQGLMVASAMAIAARETRAGEAPVRVLEARLAALAVGSWEELCPAIRKGRFDDDATLRELLWELALLKLRESNPKLLKSHGLG
jgi:hypothetical protein